MNPKSVDVDGKPFGEGVYFCAHPSLQPGVDPILCNKAGNTTNFNRWLETNAGLKLGGKKSQGIQVRTKRPAAASPVKPGGAAGVKRLFGGLAAAGAAAAGAGTAAATRVGSTSTRTYRYTVTLLFSLAQLQRLLVAALLFTISAAYILTNPWMKFFLLAASGGTITVLAVTAGPLQRLRKSSRRIYLPTPAQS